MMKAPIHVERRGILAKEQVAEFEICTTLTDLKEHILLVPIGFASA